MSITQQHLSQERPGHRTCDRSRLQYTCLSYVVLCLGLKSKRSPFAVRYRIYGYHAKQPAPTCLPTEMDSSPQDELTVVDESDFAILSLDSGFQKFTNSKLCRFLEPVYWLTPAYILQRFFRGAY